MLTQSFGRISGDPHGARPPTCEHSPQPANKSARTRVLVVDDEALIRWAVVETLGRLDYETSEAEDGASAVRAVSPAGDGVEPGGVDVVLLDLRLPDCSDLRVLSAIRQASPLTAVILMTANASPEVLREAWRLGVFAIVDKPFAMEALAPLVASALAARSR